MDSPRPAGHRFLPEVEGLRAVAAVLVAVYHVFLGRVSGGVDVFFVIAGFLITTSLLGQADGGDRIRAGRYLARLAVRLLPIAILVLLFVIIGTLLWIPDTRRGSMLGEITASALYVENWALAAKAIDYAARGELKSPVQHFWAMSVQGQFYVLWLALVGVLALVVRPRRLRLVLGVVLAGLLATSLAYSAWLTAENQAFAYFNTGARMWEFAAGGLLAVTLEPLRRTIGRLGPAGDTLRGLAGWAGLALLLSCGLVLTVATAFPGIAALWPVTGALLVMLATGETSRWSPNRLLASAPLVFVGGVAYALYLWHWPLLVFAKLGNVSGTIDLQTGLGIILAAFVLAILTTRVVERPIRLRLAAPHRPWAVAAAGATSLAAVVLAVAVAGQVAWIEPEAEPDASLTALVEALEEAEAADLEDQDTDTAAEGDDPWAAGLGAGAFGAGAFDPDALLDASGDPAAPPASLDADPAPAQPSGGLAGEATPTPRPTASQMGRSAGPFVPTLAKVVEDWNDLKRDGCQQGSSTPGLIICARGDPEGRFTAMLIGGSHATHWYPALNTIARRRDWRLLTAVKGSCRITPTREFVPGDPEDQSCRTWLADLLAWIKANPPDVIITTGTATSPDGEFLPGGYVKVWRMLERRGIPVIAIRDTPRAPFDRVDCLAKHRKQPWKCDIPRSPTLDPVNPLLLREDIPGNVILVDVNDWLCSVDTCPAIVGHVVVYRDAHHLTETYVRTLVPVLAAQIPKDPVAAVAGS